MDKRALGLVATALLLVPQVAWPQAHQPYAGLQDRPVKALSPQETADLRAGRGMGLALAAELNGYPGPLHVLELARELGLSDAQQASVGRLFEAMKSEAVALGEKVVAAEAELDRRFADRSITGASLDEDVRTIAALRGALRAAHLRYHLAMVEVLSPAQVARYAELRGYRADKPAAPGEHRHRH
jgi:hypothetical protein